ncbi:hypothetical protein HDU91_000845 [Kappamyces sp. JEL0680]|nr:hypothetical protein HDU91_000845 [Kappamyces sp. JEL0680]
MPTLQLLQSNDVSVSFDASDAAASSLSLKEKSSARSSAPRRLQQNPFIEILKEKEKDPNYDGLPSMQKSEATGGMLPKKAPTVLVRKGTLGTSHTINRKFTRKKSMATDINDVFGDIMSRVKHSYKMSSEFEAIPDHHGDTKHEEGSKFKGEVVPFDFRAEIRKFDYLEELRSLRINQMELEEEESIDIDVLLDEVEKEVEEVVNWDESPPPDILHLAGDADAASDTTRQEHFTKQRTFSSSLGGLASSESFRKDDGLFPKRSSFLAMTLGAKGNHFQRKASVANKLRDSVIALPSGPREFVDPAILFAEKQMEAWEKMKKEMLLRTGSKKAAKFKSISSVMSVVVGLKKLGMNPNLLSTLAIVIQIKLWKKRAIDARITRREPTRKLVSQFEKQLMVEVPYPVYCDIISNALDVLLGCKLRYAANLGESHIRTKSISKYIKSLHKIAAPATSKPGGNQASNNSVYPSFTSIASSLQTMGPKSKAHLGSKSNLKKVYPQEADDAALSDVVLEMDNVLRTAALSPIRGQFSRSNSIVDDVLLEIDEEGSQVRPSMEKPHVDTVIEEEEEI